MEDIEPILSLAHERRSATWRPPMPAPGLPSSREEAKTFMGNAETTNRQLRDLSSKRLGVSSRKGLLKKTAPTYGQRKSTVTHFCKTDRY